MVFTEKCQTMVCSGIYPIYMIEVMEKDGSELSNKDGFPDFGSTNSVGFFYSYGESVQALNSNKKDIREDCYNYAMIKRIFPGVENFAGLDDCTFFVWDSEKMGFYEKDYPEHLASIYFGL